MARHPGDSYTFEGDEAEFAGSTSGLVKRFGVIMVVMYGMLAIPWQSYWKPVIILSAIPFGMVCAIWDQAIRGLAVRFSSMGGMMALVGVVSQILPMVRHASESD